MSIGLAPPITPDMLDAGVDELVIMANTELMATEPRLVIKRIYERMRALEPTAKRQRIEQLKRKRA